MLISIIVLLLSITLTITCLWWSSKKGIIISICIVYMAGNGFLIYEQKKNAPPSIAEFQSGLKEQSKSFCNEFNKVDQNMQTLLDGMFELQKTKRTEEEIAEEEKKLQEAKAKKDEDRTVNDYLVLSNNYFCKGEYLDAFKMIQKGANLKPQSKKDKARIHRALAAIYIGTGRSYLAISELNQSKSFDPQNVQLHCLLGTAYMVDENYYQAIETYDKAIELGGNEVGVLINIAIAHSEIGDYKKAESALKEAIKIENDADLYFRLANLYNEQGEYEKAETEYKKAIQVSSQRHLPAWNALMWLYSENPLLLKDFPL